MSKPYIKEQSRIWFILILLITPLAFFIWCVGVGRYGLGHTDTLRVLTQAALYGRDSVSPVEFSVAVNIRLSRVLLALICGAGLAAAGVGLQAVFSNPLVSPDTLGVASGASFGAALALLLRANLIAVQLSALCFGLFACFLTYCLSNSKGGRKTVMLILSGLVVSSLFQAFVSLVKYVADTDEVLPGITYWLMGSLYTANYRAILLGAPPIIASCICLFLIRWKINILSLPEDEARSLGINIRGMRLCVIICSAVITASVVSICGQIGWVGLLIPHICRMLFGSNHMRVIPAAISLGGAFLLCADTIARSAAVTEIPVSILTAVAGAPVFLILLRKTGGTA